MAPNGRGTMACACDISEICWGLATVPISLPAYLSACALSKQMKLCAMLGPQLLSGSGPH